MQHFRVKVFGECTDGFELAAAIPAFHRWIRERRLPGVWIDVADYSHVPAGPGILLVGHDAFCGIGLSDGRPGLLYTRRTVVPGSPAEQFRAVWRAAYDVCRRLEREAEFSGKLRFHAGDCEFSINDRLLAPNNEETAAKVLPELSRFLDFAWAGIGFAWEREADPLELFTLRLRATSPVDLAAALARLGEP